MNKVKINSDVELKDRLVAINRVTKVTKGGRTFTFAAIVVVGDGNGIIGWGLGKAGEVTAAIAKGVESAKKNLVKVPVLKGTIPHEMEARFGGAQVFFEACRSRYWTGSRWCYACCSGKCWYQGCACKVKGFF